MENLRDEIKARNLLYETVYNIMTDEEKKITKYQAVNNVLNKLLKEREQLLNAFSKNPDLKSVIQTIINENVSFKEALIINHGSNYLNEPESSDLFETLLKNETEREEEIKKQILNYVTTNEKKEKQYEKIDHFCRKNGLNFDTYINEIETYITNRIGKYEMNEKELFAYNVAINIIKTTKSEEDNTGLEENFTNSKCYIIIYNSTPYVITKKGEFIKIKEQIDPQKQLYEYTEVFAEEISNFKPKEWAEIKHNIAYSRNLNNEEDIIKIIKQKSKEKNYLATIKKLENEQKAIQDIPTKITEMAKISSEKNAIIQFWNMVSKIFNLKIEDDDELLSQKTILQIVA